MSKRNASTESLLASSSSSILDDSTIVKEDSCYSLDTELKGARRNFGILHLTIGLCTLINLLVYLSAQSLSNRPAVSFLDIANLRRANPFIGLERAEESILRTLPSIARNETIFPPDVISIVNASDPHKAYGDDYSTWLYYHRGWMPPHDRAFVMSNQVSTIVQFRANDYKMEQCQLRLKLPAETANSSLVFGDSKVLPRISIYLLDTTDQLYTKTLSYANRPPRIQELTSLVLDYGIEFHHAFHCPLNSLWTFEFALSEPQNNAGDQSVHWTQGWTMRLPKLDFVQLPSYQYE